MSKRKTPDDVVIEALVRNGTVTAAAKELGLTTRTIFKRLEKPEFRMLYEKSKTEVIRGSLQYAQQYLNNCVDVLADLMNDNEVNAPTRYQSALALLQHIDTLKEAIADAEAKQEEQSKSFFDI